MLEVIDVNAFKDCRDKVISNKEVIRQTLREYWKLVSCLDILF